MVPPVVGLSDSLLVLLSGHVLEPGSVRTAVGGAVGVVVGVAVGKSVGVDVGAMVGASVGMFVGDEVSSPVGIAVGERVGDIVRVAVGGEPVGPALGAPVGSLEG